ncbi:hypothetical protein EX30DRAFT_252079 [Ascodesmis nigricans]|uniref:Uncharacterized protein n=1 Tax=Ascodesmis nigricans TaxID=341454 RepID=A0A4V3SIV6_9PEZI|nr:hypothetical protein EX30DRAFT_252079 [Ascodesmis nigricans]
MSTSTTGGHRRIASIRSTTRNLFKGKSTHDLHNKRLADAANTSKPSTAVASPEPLAEEDRNVSPTDLIPFTAAGRRVGVEPFSIFNDIPSRPTQYGSLYHSSSAFDVGGRNRRPSHSAEPIFGEPIMPHNTHAGNQHARGETASVKSKGSDPDAMMSDNSASAATTSAKNRKTGAKAAKLRMALSLLRRRSNSNLRKAYVEPIGEAEERDNNWPPSAVKGPVLDPDIVKPVEKIQNARRSGSVSSPAVAHQHHGFKFSLPERHSPRNVLTKSHNPNYEVTRPRRATVASIVLEQNLMPQVPPTPGPPVWTTDLSPRPRSSHSSIGGGFVPEPSSDSIFSRESIPLGGATPDGGLFPRPASIRRDWNITDGFSKRESVIKSGLPSSRVPSMQSSRLSDRARPVSFGGVSSTVFGGMKITEAASLEVRVKELESQLSQLSNLVGPPPDWPLRDEKISEALSPKARLLGPENGLGIIDTDGVSPNTSTISISAPKDAQLTLTPQLSPTQTPADEAESNINLSDTHQRSETLQPLENFHRSLHIPNPDGRPATTSTLRADRPLSITSPPPRSSAHITATEFHELLDLIKQEQKARKLLEARVDQLTTLLRHTGIHISPLASATTSSSCYSTSPNLRDDNNSNLDPLSTVSVIRERDTVPTPELTPPPTSNLDTDRPGAHTHTFFQSFDGGATDTEVEDNVSVNTFELPPQHRDSTATGIEVFRTPMEERRSFGAPASPAVRWDAGVGEREGGREGGPYQQQQHHHQQNQVMRYEQMAFPQYCDDRTLSLGQITRRPDPVAI